MNPNFSRSLIAMLIVLEGVSLARLEARPLKHPLDEQAALKILLQTVKRDHVYDKRISLDCVMFDTEETTRIYFEIAIREKHTRKCGGDPDLNPVVDRYRVARSSGRIELYDAAKDNWQPYQPGKAR